MKTKLHSEVMSFYRQKNYKYKQKNKKNQVATAIIHNT